MQQEEKDKRYWVLSRCLDIMQGIQRTFSKDGLALQARPEFEAAFDEMEDILRTIRGMMRELQK